MGRHQQFLKFVAIVVIMCLLAQDASLAAQAVNRTTYNVQSAEKADLPSTIYDVPERLGAIDESFEGTNGKHITFILDAHDSLDAQKNIVRIIQQAINSGIKTVFEEGYEGELDTDKWFGGIEDPQIKRKVSYYYLDQLKIGAAEFAHINRHRRLGRRPEATGQSSDASQSSGLRSPVLPADWKLVGADDKQAYLENVRAFGDSEKVRDQILRDTQAIQRELKNLSQKNFSDDARKWILDYQRFHENSLPLIDYLKRWLPRLSSEQVPLLHRILNAAQDLEIAQSIQKTRAVEVLAELESFEIALEALLFKDLAMKEIWQAIKTMSAIERLAELKISNQDLSHLKNNLKAFKTENLARQFARAKKNPVVLSKRWETLIQNALKFYELAHKRDEAVERALIAWRDQSKAYNVQSTTNDDLRSTVYDQNSNAILVFGGFHREGITEILRRNGFSYTVIIPKIVDFSKRHQALYRQLMSIGPPASGPRALKSVQAARPMSGFFEPGFADEVNRVAALAQAHTGNLDSFALFAARGIIGENLSRPSGSRNTRRLLIKKKLPELRDASPGVGLVKPPARSEMRADEVVYEEMSREKIEQHWDEIQALDAAVFSATPTRDEFLGKPILGAEDTFHIDEQFSRLAFVDGKVVGFIVGHVEQASSWNVSEVDRNKTLNTEGMLRLRRLAVDPSIRHSGVGKSLLHEMLLAGQKHGFEKLFVRTRFIPESGNPKFDFFTTHGLEIAGTVHIKGYPSTVLVGEVESILDKTRSPEKLSIRSIFHPQHSTWTAVWALIFTFLHSFLIIWRDLTMSTPNYWQALNWLPDFTFTMAATNIAVYFSSKSKAADAANDRSFYSDVIRDVIWSIPLIMAGAEITMPFIRKAGQTGHVFDWADLAAIGGAYATLKVLHLTTIPQTGRSEMRATEFSRKKAEELRALAQDIASEKKAGAQEIAERYLNDSKKYFVTPGTNDWLLGHLHRGSLPKMAELAEEHVVYTISIAKTTLRAHVIPYIPIYGEEHTYAQNYFYIFEAEKEDAKEILGHALVANFTPLGNADNKIWSIGLQIFDQWRGEAIKKEFGFSASILRDFLAAAIVKDREPRAITIDALYSVTQSEDIWKSGVKTAAFWLKGGFYPLRLPDWSEQIQEELQTDKPFIAHGLRSWNDLIQSGKDSRNAYWVLPFRTEASAIESIYSDLPRDLGYRSEARNLPSRRLWLAGAAATTAAGYFAGNFVLNLTGWVLSENPSELIQIAATSHEEKSLVALEKYYRKIRFDQTNGNYNRFYWSNVKSVANHPSRHVRNLLVEMLAHDGAYVPPKDLKELSEKDVRPDLVARLFSQQKLTFPKDYLFLFENRSFEDLDYFLKAAKRLGWDGWSFAYAELGLSGQYAGAIQHVPVELLLKEMRKTEHKKFKTLFVDQLAERIEASYARRKKELPGSWAQTRWSISEEVLADNSIQTEEHIFDYLEKIQAKIDSSVASQRSELRFVAQTFNYGNKSEEQVIAEIESAVDELDNEEAYRFRVYDAARGTGREFIFSRKIRVSALASLAALDYLFEWLPILAAGGVDPKIGFSWNILANSTKHDGFRIESNRYFVLHPALADKVRELQAEAGNALSVLFPDIIPGIDTEPYVIHAAKLFPTGEMAEPQKAIQLDVSIDGQVQVRSEARDQLAIKNFFFGLGQREMTGFENDVRAFFPSQILEKFNHDDEKPLAVVSRYDQMGEYKIMVGSVDRGTNIYLGNAHSPRTAQIAFKALDEKTLFLKHGWLPFYEEAIHAPEFQYLERYGWMTFAHWLRDYFIPFAQDMGFKKIWMVRNPKSRRALSEEAMRSLGFQKQQRKALWTLDLNELPPILKRSESRTALFEWVEKNTQVIGSGLASDRAKLSLFFSRILNEAYQAQKNGTVDAVKQEIDQALNAMTKHWSVSMNGEMAVWLATASMAFSNPRNMIMRMQSLDALLENVQLDVLFYAMLAMVNHIRKNKRHEPERMGENGRFFLDDLYLTGSTQLKLEGIMEKFVSAYVRAANQNESFLNEHAKTIGEAKGVKRKHIYLRGLAWALNPSVHYLEGTDNLHYEPVEVGKINDLRKDLIFKLKTRFKAEDLESIWKEVLETDWSELGLLPIHQTRIIHAYSPASTLKNGSAAAVSQLPLGVFASPHLNLLSSQEAGGKILTDSEEDIKRALEEDRAFFAQSARSEARNSKFQLLWKHLTDPVTQMNTALSFLRKIQISREERGLLIPDKLDEILKHEDVIGSGPNANLNNTVALLRILGAHGIFKLIPGLGTIGAIGIGLVFLPGPMVFAGLFLFALQGLMRAAATTWFSAGTQLPARAALIILSGIPFFGLWATPIYMLALRDQRELGVAILEYGWDLINSWEKIKKRLLVPALMALAGGLLWILKITLNLGFTAIVFTASLVLLAASKSADFYFWLKREVNSMRIKWKKNPPLHLDEAQSLGEREKQIQAYLEDYKKDLLIDEIFQSNRALLDISLAWHEFGIRNRDDVLLFASAEDGGQFVQSHFDWIKAIVEKYEISKDKHVLDIGSGNGLVALAFHILTGAKVTSIEIDPKRWSALQAFLKFLKEKKGIEYKQVEFKNADFLETDISSFDYLYFYFTSPIKYEDDFSLRVINHLKDNLKPGAKFISPAFFFEEEIGSDWPWKTSKRGEKFNALDLGTAGITYQSIDLGVKGLGTGFTTVLSRVEPRSMDDKNQDRLTYLWSQYQEAFQANPIYQTQAQTAFSKWLIGQAALDLGAGASSFVDRLKRLGNQKTYRVDINPKTHRRGDEDYYARHFEQSFFDPWPLENESLKIVYSHWALGGEVPGLYPNAWDMPHEKNPDATFANELKRTLHPDGLAYFELGFEPNPELVRELSRTGLYVQSPPDHTEDFGEQSLAVIVTKKPFNAVINSIQAELEADNPRLAEIVNQEIGAMRSEMREMRVDERSVRALRGLDQFVETIFEEARKKAVKDDELLERLRKLIEKNKSFEEAAHAIIRQFIAQPLLAIEQTPAAFFKQRLFEKYVERYLAPQGIPRRSFLKAAAAFFFAPKLIGQPMLDAAAEAVAAPAKSYILKFDATATLAQAGQSLGRTLGQELSQFAPIFKGALQGLWQNEETLWIPELRTGADQLLMGEALHTVPGALSSSGMPAANYPDLVHGQLLAQKAMNQPAMQAVIEQTRLLNQVYRGLSPEAQQAMNSELSEIAQMKTPVSVEDVARLRQRAEELENLGPARKLTEFLPSDFNHEMAMPRNVYLLAEPKTKDDEPELVLLTQGSESSRGDFEFASYEVYSIPLSLIDRSRPERKIKDQIRRMTFFNPFGNPLRRGYVFMRVNDQIEPHEPLSIMNSYLSSIDGNITERELWIEPSIERWFEIWKKNFSQIKRPVDGDVLLMYWHQALKQTDEVVKPLRENWSAEQPPIESVYDAVLYYKMVQPEVLLAATDYEVRIAMPALARLLGWEDMAREIEVDLEALEKRVRDSHVAHRAGRLYEEPIPDYGASSGLDAENPFGFWGSVDPMDEFEALSESDSSNRSEMRDDIDGSVERLHRTTLNQTGLPTQAAIKELVRLEGAEVLDFESASAKAQQMIANEMGFNLVQIAMTLAFGGVFYFGTVWHQSFLKYIADHRRLPIKQLQKILGVLPNHSAIMIFMTFSPKRNFDHDYLNRQLMLAEVLHLLEGPYIDHPLWNAEKPQQLILAKETINALLQLLFYREDELGLFYSAHTKWDERDKNNLYVRYRLNEGYDPNKNILLILKKLEADIRDNAKILPGSKKTVIDVLMGEAAKQKGQRAALEVYLKILSERGQFHRYEKLFPPVPARSEMRQIKIQIDDLPQISQRLSPKNQESGTGVVAVNGALFTIEYDENIISNLKQLFLSLGIQGPSSLFHVYVNHLKHVGPLETQNLAGIRSLRIKSTKADDKASAVGGGVVTQNTPPSVSAPADKDKPAAVTELSETIHFELDLTLAPDLAEQAKLLIGFQDWPIEKKQAWWQNGRMIDILKIEKVAGKLFSYRIEWNAKNTRQRDRFVKRDQSTQSEQGWNNLQSLTYQLGFNDVPAHLRSGSSLGIDTGLADGKEYVVATPSGRDSAFRSAYAAYQEAEKNWQAQKTQGSLDMLVNRYEALRHVLMIVAEDSEHEESDAVGTESKNWLTRLKVQLIARASTLNLSLWHLEEEELRFINQTTNKSGKVEFPEAVWLLDWDRLILDEPKALEEDAAVSAEVIAAAQIKLAPPDTLLSKANETSAVDFTLLPTNPSEEFETRTGKFHFSAETSMGLVSRDILGISFSLMQDLDLEYQSPGEKNFLLGETRYIALFWRSFSETDRALLRDYFGFHGAQAIRDLDALTAKYEMNSADETGRRIAHLLELLTIGKMTALYRKEKALTEEEKQKLDKKAAEMEARQKTDSDDESLLHFDGEEEAVEAAVQSTGESQRTGKGKKADYSDILEIKSTVGFTDKERRLVEVIQKAKGTASRADMAKDLGASIATFDLWLKRFRDRWKSTLAPQQAALESGDRFAIKPNASQDLPRNLSEEVLLALPQTLRRIYELAIAGHTYESIGKQVGLDDTTVSAAMTRRLPEEFKGLKTGWQRLADSAELDVSQVQTYFGQLDEKTQKALSLYYGIGVQRPDSLKEIIDEMEGFREEYSSPEPSLVNLIGRGAAQLNNLVESDGERLQKVMGIKVEALPDAPEDVLYALFSDQRTAYDMLRTGKKFEDIELALKLTKGAVSYKVKGIRELIAQSKTGWDLLLEDLEWEQDKKEALKTAFENLDENEKEFLKRRYGIERQRETIAETLDWMRAQGLLHNQKRADLYYQAYKKNVFIKITQVLNHENVVERFTKEQTVELLRKLTAEFLGGLSDGERKVAEAARALFESNEKATNLEIAERAGVSENNARYAITRIKEKALLAGIKPSPRPSPLEPSKPKHMSREETISLLRRLPEEFVSSLRDMEKKILKIILANPEFSNFQIANQAGSTEGYVSTALADIKRRAKQQGLVKAQDDAVGDAAKTSELSPVVKPQEQSDSNLFIQNQVPPVKLARPVPADQYFIVGDITRADLIWADTSMGLSEDVDSEKLKRLLAIRDAWNYLRPIQREIVRQRHGMSRYESIDWKSISDRLNRHKIGTIQLHTRTLEQLQSLENGAMALLQDTGVPPEHLQEAFNLFSSKPLHHLILKLEYGLDGTPREEDDTAMAKILKEKVSADLDRGQVADLRKLLLKQLKVLAIEKGWASLEVMQKRKRKKAVSKWTEAELEKFMRERPDEELAARGGVIEGGFEYVYNLMRAKHGTWEAALRFYGRDPEAIRLRSVLPNRLAAAAASQAAAVSLGKSQPEMTLSLRAAGRSATAVLFKGFPKEFVAKLGDKEKKIFDLFIEHPEYSNQKIAELANSTQGAVGVALAIIKRKAKEAGLVPDEVSDLKQEAVAVLAKDKSDANTAEADAGFKTEPGKSLLAGWLQHPEGKTWEGSVREGAFFLGVTNSQGGISIPLLHQQYYRWFVAGRRESGWEVWVENIRKEESLLVFDVRLVHPRRGQKINSYYVGDFQKDLHTRARPNQSRPEPAKARKFILVIKAAEKEAEVAKPSREAQRNSTKDFLKTLPQIFTQGLEPQERDVLRLMVGSQDYSNEEIAAQLKIRSDAVRAALSRIRSKAKKAGFEPAKSLGLEDKAEEAFMTVSETEFALSSEQPAIVPASPVVLPVIETITLTKEEDFYIADLIQRGASLVGMVSRSDGHHLRPIFAAILGIIKVTAPIFEKYPNFENREAALKVFNDLKEIELRIQKLPEIPAPDLPRYRALSAAPVAVLKPASPPTPLSPHEKLAHDFQNDVRTILNALESLQSRSIYNRESYDRFKEELVGFRGRFDKIKKALEEEPGLANRYAQIQNQLRLFENALRAPEAQLKAAKARFEGGTVTPKPAPSIPPLNRPRPSVPNVAAAERKHGHGHYARARRLEKSDRPAQTNDWRTILLETGKTKEALEEDLLHLEELLSQEPQDVSAAEKPRMVRLAEIQLAWLRLLAALFLPSEKPRAELNKAVQEFERLFNQDAQITRDKHRMLMADPRYQAYDAAVSRLNDASKTRLVPAGKTVSGMDLFTLSMAETAANAFWDKHDRDIARSEMRDPEKMAEDIFNNFFLDPLSRKKFLTTHLTIRTIGEDRGIEPQDIGLWLLEWDFARALVLKQFVMNLGGAQTVLPERLESALDLDSVYSQVMELVNHSDYRMILDFLGSDEAPIDFGRKVDEVISDVKSGVEQVETSAGAQELIRRIQSDANDYKRYLDYITGIVGKESFWNFDLEMERQEWRDISMRSESRKGADWNDEVGLWSSPQVIERLSQFVLDPLSVSLWRLHASAWRISERDAGSVRDEVLRRSKDWPRAAVFQQEDFSALSFLHLQWPHVKARAAFMDDPDRFAVYPLWEELESLSKKIRESRIYTYETIRTAARYSGIWGHGTANSMLREAKNDYVRWRYRAVQEYDLEDEWAMLNIMIEGTMSSGEGSPFAGMNLGGNTPDSWGPFWILTRDFQYFYKFHPSGREDHWAYLVPNQAAIDFFERGLELAVSRKLMTEEERQDVRSKLVTYDEFNALEERLWNIRDQKISMTEAVAQTGVTRSVRSEARSAKQEILYLISDSEILSQLTWWLPMMKAYWFFRGHRMKIIRNATSDDLKKAVQDNGIRKLAVVGHGSWNSWKANDKNVTEDELDSWIEGETQKKDLFITYTCCADEARDGIYIPADKFGWSATEEPYYNVRGAVGVTIASFFFDAMELYTVDDLLNRDSWRVRFFNSAWPWTMYGGLLIFLDMEIWTVLLTYLQIFFGNPSSVGEAFIYAGVAALGLRLIFGIRAPFFWSWKKAKQWLADKISARNRYARKIELIYQEASQMLSSMTAREQLLDEMTALWNEKLDEIAQLSEASQHKESARFTALQENIAAAKQRSMQARSARDENTWQDKAKKIVGLAKIIYESRETASKDDLNEILAERNKLRGLKKVADKDMQREFDLLVALIPTGERMIQELFELNGVKGNAFSDEISSELSRAVKAWKQSRSEARLDELLDKNRRTADEWKEMISLIKSTLPLAENVTPKMIVGAPAAKGKLRYQTLVMAVHKAGGDYASFGLDAEEKNSISEKETKIKAAVQALTAEKKIPSPEAVLTHLGKPSHFFKGLDEGALKDLGLIFPEKEKAADEKYRPILERFVREGKTFGTVREIVSATGVPMAYLNRLGAVELAKIGILTGGTNGPDKLSQRFRKAREARVAANSGKGKKFKTIAELAESTGIPATTLAHYTDKQLEELGYIPRPVKLERAVKNLLAEKPGQVISYEVLAQKVTEMDLEDLKPEQLREWNLYQKPPFTAQPGWRKRFEPIMKAVEALGANDSELELFFNNSLGAQTVWIWQIEYFVAKAADILKQNPYFRSKWNEQTGKDFTEAVMRAHAVTEPEKSDLQQLSPKDAALKWLSATGGAETLKPVGPVSTITISFEGFSDSGQTLYEKYEFEKTSGLNAQALVEQLGFSSQPGSKRSLTDIKQVLIDGVDQGRSWHEIGLSSRTSAIVVRHKNYQKSQVSHAEKKADAPAEKISAPRTALKTKPSPSRAAGRRDARYWTIAMISAAQELEVSKFFDAAEQAIQAMNREGVRRDYLESFVRVFDKHARQMDLLSQAPEDQEASQRYEAILKSMGELQASARSESRVSSNDTVDRVRLAKNEKRYVQIVKTALKRVKPGQTGELVEIETGLSAEEDTRLDEELKRLAVYFAEAGDSEKAAVMFWLIKDDAYAASLADEAKALEGLGNQRKEIIRAASREPRAANSHTQAVSGTKSRILISRAELGSMSKENFKAFYKFFYQNQELELSVYGSGSKNPEEETRVGLLEAVPSAKTGRVSFFLDPSSAAQGGEAIEFSSVPGTKTVRGKKIAAADIRTVEGMASGFLAAMGMEYIEEKGFVRVTSGIEISRFFDFLSWQVFATSA